MSKKRTYNHLSPEERAIIMIEHQNGASLRVIARRIQRSTATISRELNRAGCRSVSDRYEATAAAEAYRQRRRHSRRKPRLEHGSALYQFVHDRLVYFRWSPQQIASRLRYLPIDTRPGLVSHETIYATIYAQPRGALKQGMIQALRQAKNSRGTRRTTSGGASFVPESLRIVHRPEDIKHRLVPGHWEGDFIKGAFNRSAIGTLVERKTRFVTLCRMDGCTAGDALEGFT